MEQLENVDIKENYILKLNNDLLAVLLTDRTTNKNLIWATDNYKDLGAKYYPESRISIDLITGYHGNIIKPRVNKSKKEQQDRVKNKAEVFTPSWICNKQNNLVDNAWFERDCIFNIEKDTTWETTKNKIQFPNLVGKTWQDYVRELRMEVSCGEAPYLTSRYDTVSGDYIEVKNRIGLYDRKLRVISENVDSEPEWMEYAIEATKSIYGYDWQGDNILLARENLLFAFAESYFEKFEVAPIIEHLLKIAEIISWNIFQMDGLKYVIPNSCKPIPKMQISLFPEDDKPEECAGCVKGNNNKHTGIYVKVMNWETKRKIKFISLINNKE